MEFRFFRVLSADSPAATTRGPRRARLRGGVGAERPDMPWDEMPQ